MTRIGQTLRTPPSRALLLATLALPLACAHSVEVLSSPPGATIVVDGKEIGQAPVRFEESDETASGEHVIVARLNGYETAEMRVLRTRPNPLALIAVLPLCGTLGWAGALVPLVGGVVLFPFTLGCSLVAGPTAAAILAGAGCAWMLVTSPTLLVLPNAQTLPDVVELQLQPSQTFDQHDQGLSWPPEFTTDPGDDGYWQNPSPPVEGGSVPLPGDPSSQPDSQTDSGSGSGSGNPGQAF